MKYTVDYFIRFYTRIPNKRWTIGVFSNFVQIKGKWIKQCCALGHLHAPGESLTISERTSTFCQLLADQGHDIVMVNDGSDPKYQQPTPKQRILAALQDIKKYTP